MSTTMSNGRQIVDIQGVTGYTNPQSPAAHGHSFTLRLLAGDNITLNEDSVSRGVTISSSVNYTVMLDELQRMVDATFKDLREEIATMIERIDEFTGT